MNISVYSRECGCTFSFIQGKRASYMTTIDPKFLNRCKQHQLSYNRTAVSSEQQFLKSGIKADYSTVLTLHFKMWLESRPRGRRCIR